MTRARAIWTGAGAIVPWAASGAARHRRAADPALSANHHVLCAGRRPWGFPDGFVLRRPFQPRIAARALGQRDRENSRLPYALLRGARARRAGSGQPRRLDVARADLRNVGCQRGYIQVLGVCAYAAPLLSTLALVAPCFAQPINSVLLAAALISGGAVIAAPLQLPEVDSSLTIASPASKGAGSLPSDEAS